MEVGGRPEVQGWQEGEEEGACEQAQTGKQPFTKDGCRKEMEGTEKETYNHNSNKDDENDKDNDDEQDDEHDDENDDANNDELVDANDSNDCQ